MGPYPLGVDPVWHGTKTELPFLNSMKMKMSILLGVVHMNLGIIMSLLNNNYFRWGGRGPGGELVDAERARRVATPPCRGGSDRPDSKANASACVMPRRLAPRMRALLLGTGS